MTVHLRCPLCGGPLSVKRGVNVPAWVVCWGGCSRTAILAHIANLKPEQLRLPFAPDDDPPRRSAPDP